MSSNIVKTVLLSLLIFTLITEIPCVSGFNLFRLGKTSKKDNGFSNQAVGICMNSIEIYPHNETKIDCFPDENASRLFHIMAKDDHIGFSWQLPKTLPRTQTNQRGHDLIVFNPMPSQSGPFACSSHVSFEGDPRKKTFAKHVLFVDSPILTSVGTYSVHLDRCGVEPQTMEEISHQFRDIICHGVEGCTRAVTSRCDGDKLMLDVQGMEFKMYASVSCDHICKLDQAKRLVQDDILMMQKKIMESDFSEKLQVVEEINYKTNCPPGSVLTKNRCLPCPPGSFTLTGQACDLCPPGQWESTYGSTQCKYCTKNKSLSYMGAKSAEECSSTFVGQPRFTPNSCNYYEDDHLIPGFFLGVEEEPLKN